MAWVPGYGRVEEGFLASFIKDMVEEGNPANKILADLKEAGVKIRRSTGLELIRKAKGIVKSRPYVASVNYDKYPDPDRLPTAEFDISGEYGYHVKMTGRNRLTGEKFVRHTTISTNRLLTKREAVEAAMDYIAEAEEDYPFEFTAITVTDIVTHP